MNEKTILKTSIGLGIGVFSLISIVAVLVWFFSPTEAQIWDSASDDAKLLFLGLIIAGLLSSK